MHAKIGTPIHITEKLLNQVSGTISGFAAIYNRHTYLEEMQTALDAYDENLAAKHWLSPSESRSMCFKYKWQKNADKTYDFMF